MASEHLELELSEEQRALLDEACGETDLATYVLNTVIRVTRRRLARHADLPTRDAEMSTEEHIRKAAAARINPLEHEEFEQIVREGIAQRRAARKSNNEAEPSATHHLRRAAAAHANPLEIDEFERLVREDIARDLAAYEAGKAK